MKQLLILSAIVILSSCGKQNKVKMNTEVKEKVGTIVLVLAKMNPEYAKEEIIKLSEAIDPMVDEFEGYLGRKMIFGIDNPNLMGDIVFYENVKAFEDASEIEMKSETCQKFFATMLPDPETTKMLIMSPVIMTMPKQGEVKAVELVLFKTKPEFPIETVIKAAETMNAVMDKYEGYISRKLALTEDGQWMDLVYWTDQASAEKASKHIMENELAQKYFDMIDSSTMQFEHLNVVIDTER